MPGAAPCDEAFFESTRGTYGLTAQTTLASGSFYLYNWTASGLFLRRTVESPLVGSLRLVQDTSGSGKSAAQLIADDKCSAALDESGETTSLQTVSYSDTTWALLFTRRRGRCSRTSSCGRRWPVLPGKTPMCPPAACTPLQRDLCRRV